MKALIVDDERKSRELLEGMLKTFCKDIKEIQLAESVSAARTVLESYKPDVVFLDIEMPNENGMALLANYDIIPFNVVITTAYEKYALEAFYFGACDYLLKPYNPERLIKSCERKKQSQEITITNPINNSLRKITIPTLEGYVIVDIDDIEYCKAEANYTKVFFKSDKSILVSKNLRKFEDILTPYQFLRIHRSYLVNVKYIVAFVKGKAAQVKVSSGTMLEVSANKREELMTFLNII